MQASTDRLREAEHRAQLLDLHLEDVRPLQIVLRHSGCHAGREAAGAKPRTQLLARPCGRHPRRERRRRHVFEYGSLLQCVCTIGVSNESSVSVMHPQSLVFWMEARLFGSMLGVSAGLERRAMSQINKYPSHMHGAVAL